MPGSSFLITRAALLLTDKRGWRLLGALLLVLPTAAFLLVLIPAGAILVLLLAINPPPSEQAQDPAYQAVAALVRKLDISNEIHVPLVKAIDFVMDEELMESRQDFEDFIRSYFISSHTREVTVEVTQEDGTIRRETRTETDYLFFSQEKILDRLAGAPFSFDPDQVAAVLELSLLSAPNSPDDGGGAAPGEDGPPAGNGISSIVGGSPRLTQGYHGGGGVSGGIDIGAPKGTPVYAMFDGKVDYYFWKDRRGSFAGFGACAFLYSDQGDWEAVYAHLSQFDTAESYSQIAAIGSVKQYSPDVREFRYSRRVQRGDLIGYVGNTGFSFGNHLHFGLLIDGVNVNPLRYLG